MNGSPSAGADGLPKQMERYNDYSLFFLALFSLMTLTTYIAALPAVITATTDIAAMSAVLHHQSALPTGVVGVMPFIAAL